MNRSRFALPICVQLLALLLTSMTCARGLAADWTLKPSVRAGQSYIDNFNVTPDALEVWVTKFAARLNSSLQTEQFQTDILGEYRGSRYWNESSLDADDGTLRIDSRYATEYHNFGFIAEGILDHPSSTQLEAGSQIFDRIERLRLALTPSWSWTPDEYSSLQTYYRYDATWYENNPTIATNFTNFFSHTVNSVYTRAVEQNTSVFSDFSFIETINDQLGFRSDQFSLLLGFNHAFSETFNVSLAGGGVILFSENRVQRLVPNFQTFTFDIVTEEVENSQTGYIISASARKKLPNTELSAQYRRNLAPTLNGGQIVQEGVTLRANRRLSNYLVADVGLGASQADQIQSTLSQQSRRNLFANVSLIWQIAKQWQLVGGYRYRWLDRQGSATADRNTVYFTVRYDLFPIFLD